LTPAEIFKSPALAEIQAFFKKLPVIQRARWRWVFPEPEDSLSYPRQRARREIEEGADWMMAETLASESAPLARHNKVAPVFKVSPVASAAWASYALQSTNNVFDMVPPIPRESGMFTSVGVWIKMIDLAHSEGLLKPGAINVVRKWAEASTARQRDALSNILLLLSDHMVMARGGQSETKIQYGPKAIQLREAASCGDSSLGRPSTAPIVSAMQRKLEEKLKKQDEASQRRAEEMIAKRRASQGMGMPREGDDRFAGRFNPFATNIPMKWPMKAALNETTSQAQQRCVNPSHVANGRDPPSIAGNPPASCLVRHIGGPTWHGDSLYPQLYPVAARSFPAVWNWPDGQQAGSVPRHGPLIKRPLTAAIPTV